MLLEQITDYKKYLLITQIISVYQCSISCKGIISCIGRKLVLDQRVEEEIEEVVAVIGNDATICGFYSYGEIAPFHGENNCQLHNQTMTITLISE